METIVYGITSKKPRKVLRSESERNELIRNNYPLIQWCLGKLANRFPGRILDDDAYSVGHETLLRAAEIWNKDHLQKAKFSTYAIRAIFHRVSQYLMRRGLIHTPEERKSQFLPFIHEAWAIQSLDDEVPNGGGGTFVETVPADGYSPWEMADHRLKADVANQVLVKFPGRVGVIMRLHFQGDTRAEIGRKLGICRERVRQLLNEGIVVLREQVLKKLRERPSA